MNNKTNNENNENKTNNENIPKLIFIVPYRDRVEHKQFFSKYMEFIMEDYDKNDYEIYYSHQCDKRPFNRGAMKNIGFLAMKEKYPNDYKNITFIFNDVDTVPYTKNLLNYETTNGAIKHFYGFRFALGGIFSIKGQDFERINGFPNYWGWSSEDNKIMGRALKHNLKINRDKFYLIGNQKILQFVDEFRKIIDKKELADLIKDTIIDEKGLNSINELKYNVEKCEDHGVNNYYIQVTHFKCEREPGYENFKIHNLLDKGSNQIRVNNNDLNNGRFLMQFRK
jgi:hypothetical protein